MIKTKINEGRFTDAIGRSVQSLNAKLPKPKAEKEQLQQQPQQQPTNPNEKKQEPTQVPKDWKPEKGTKVQLKNNKGQLINYRVSANRNWIGPDNSPVKKDLISTLNLEAYKILFNNANQQSQQSQDSTTQQSSNNTNKTEEQNTNNITLPNINYTDLYNKIKEIDPTNNLQDFCNETLDFIYEENPNNFKNFKDNLSNKIKKEINFENFDAKIIPNALNHVGIEFMLEFLQGQFDELTSISELVNNCYYYLEIANQQIPKFNFTKRKEILMNKQYVKNELIRKSKQLFSFIEENANKKNNNSNLNESLVNRWKQLAGIRG